MEQEYLEIGILRAFNNKEIENRVINFSKCKWTETHFVRHAG